MHHRFDLLQCVFATLAAARFAGAFVPGQVLPQYPQTWDMAKSTAIMICNASGPVDAQWGAKWGLVDLDWNGNKVHWSKGTPMNNEEDLLENAAKIRAVNPDAITWVYRNGIKALPWFTSVRTKLEDPAYWGWFMPLANCHPSPGVYVCGPDATHNLYHDFEQTPQGDCGRGIECGEYVFNHLNESLRSFLLGEYFFGPLGAGNETVKGFYVDDFWSSQGPSEMDADAVQKMGMSKTDVNAMIAAWKDNQHSWRDKILANGRFEWFLFYGGQQNAPGWNQTQPQATCLSFMRTNCGATAPTQTGALFFGYSRIQHHEAWPLPYPDQDLAAFLLVRGPFAWFGYGWTGCADSAHPFIRPPSLDANYGQPLNFCSETAPGSAVFSREFEHASVSLDCHDFSATIAMKQTGTDATYIV